MSEAHRSMPERNEDQQHCVQRYEAMLANNDQFFFDVEELELIIDHYLENNEPRRAEKVLVFAKRLHPVSVELTFCEAVVMMGLGRLSKAMELLDAIEKVEPYNEEVQLHKAGIFSQQHNHRRSVEHYKRALELAEEGLDDIYLDLAFEHENLEEYEDAIACLKNALELNPENEAVLYELAYCFDLAGADEASITFFRHFTDEHPYSSVSWYNLGNALAKLDRAEESNEALDFAIAIDERFSSAYFSKARNLLLASRFEEAITCYEETLVFDGPQAITFSYIGECYEKMERYEQALVNYDQSLALDPDWVDAWIGRGVVKDMQDRIPEALKDLEHAVRLSSENPDAWYYYASVLARAERYDEAFAAYEKLNELEPQNVDGWMDHADLLMNLKGPDAALKKFHEGAQVHKFNVRYKYRMVSYLLRAGREQQALLELEEALMADHAAHTQLLEHYPQAATLPQVMHLLELYPSMNFSLDHVPSRSEKPREEGLTMVMDKGLSLRQAEDLISGSGHLTDLVKLGFGTSYATRQLKEKIALYQSADIKVYLGGTLFEAFIARGQFEDYRKVLSHLKLDAVEVSDGSIELEHDVKLKYINTLAKDLTVLSEVGSKETGILISPARWVRMMNAELDAGSWKVIAEARESGTVGIYRPSGHAHTTLVNRIMAKVPGQDIIWEAPIKSQQTWFIKQVGANVNLGNVSPDEVIALEALRLGLRGDTFFEYLPPDMAENLRQIKTEKEPAKEKVKVKTA